MFKTRLISGIMSLSLLRSGNYYHFRQLDPVFYTSGCFTDRNERALQGNEGK